MQAKGPTHSAWQFTATGFVRVKGTESVDETGCVIGVSLSSVQVVGARRSARRYKYPGIRTGREGFQASRRRGDATTNSVHSGQTTSGSRALEAQNSNCRKAE